MDENNDFEEYDDPPPYQEPSAIDPSYSSKSLFARITRIFLLVRSLPRRETVARPPSGRRPVAVVAQPRYGSPKRR